jgi:hypothetical protein
MAESDTSPQGGQPNKVVVDGYEIEYETDPNAHNRVEPNDRGPGMDEPVHYTYAKPEDKPAARDVRVCDAVKAGDQALVRQLIKGGCSVHQRAEQDWTPLNFAAGKGDLQMVKLLVDELQADIAAVGRDRRTPLMIARAANRKEVVGYLTEREKTLGIWKDPNEVRPYCKAYYLRDLRKYQKWAEKRDNWKINKYWSDDIKAEFEKSFEDGDVVFVHAKDYSVTKSMWHGEHVVFDDKADAWVQFCKQQLQFKVPEDLL